jgi:hypothetical protein
MTYGLEDTEHARTIEFCLVGRVVRATKLDCATILLTYEDGRTARILTNNYGDTLAVDFTYPEPMGTSPDATGYSETAEQYAEETAIAEDTEYPEPSSADR